LPQRELLRRYIGPPLRQSFAEILGTEEDALIERAVAAYRERFTEAGIYENRIYPDISEGLQSLKDRGHRLWVASAKPEVFARRIIEHFSLAPLFQRVYGSEPAGRNSDKAALIAHVIERERLAPSQVYMIGDRAQDIAGGRANGTRTVGVLWGYGSEQEITHARPDIIVDSMSALLAKLT